jgi:hypothetical protein
MDIVFGSGIIKRVECDVQTKSFTIHSASSLFRPRRLPRCKWRGFFVELCTQFPTIMQSYWTLRETVARLEQATVTGEVDLLFPWHGFLWELPPAKVALLKVFTRASAGPTPETLVDFYQRGKDLVATYAQTPERNVRPQVYWRYVSPAQQALGGLELILSTQTSLLDSEPATALESALPSGEALCFNRQGEATSIALDAWHTNSAAPRAILFRPEQSELSYLEMVHPSDFAGVQLSQQDNLATVRWHLFPERLEKGVIRRGRVRGVFLPRADDQQLAVVAINEFAVSPLVLST